MGLVDVRFVPGIRSSVHPRVLALLAPLVLLVTVAPASAGGGDTQILATDAAAVRADGADLRASVSAGDAIRWQFLYGTSAWYGKSTPIMGSPKSSAVRTLTATISALTPGTVYHFRALVCRDDKPGPNGSLCKLDKLVVGRDVTFTTGPTAAAPNAPVPPAPGSPPATPATPAKPVQGQTTVMSATTGSVRVRLPGSPASTALAGTASIPIGATVDARNGAVRIATALPGGRRQSATFGGSIFRIRQSKAGSGITDVYLKGPRPAACSSSSSAARIAAASPPRTPRRLFAKDNHGRYRTFGANSVATVRGTKWETIERCDGTLTRVTEGSVSVYDRGTKRTVIVRAGHSYLARRA